MNIYSLTLNPIMVITKNILTATYEKISSYLPFLSNLQTKKLNQQPFDDCNLSNIENYTTMLKHKSNVNNSTVKFNFESSNHLNFFKRESRKYLNDWNELREFIGYNDIDTKNNEIIIRNEPTYQHYVIKYDKLKILSGMPTDMAFSN